MRTPSEFRVCIAALAIAGAFPLFAGAQPVARAITNAPAQITPAQITPAQITLAQITLAASTNYLLSANDVVSIKVFQEDDLQTTSRLSKDGTVIFPLLGPIQIGGRTIGQATAIIQDLLERDYIVNPQVILTIVEFAKRRFSVLGEVAKPGTYDMPDDRSVNLLQAISMAGGYTKIASPGKITIRRQENGKEIVLQLDGKSMAKDRNAKVFELKPDDTITVAESIF